MNTICNFKYRVLLIASASSCLALGAPAYANAVPQDVPAPAPGDAAKGGADAVDQSDPNDIIVTAQKRAESINTVPVSINAVSGSDLVQRGISDVAGLQKAVPGLVVSDTYMGTPAYYLRGVGFYDTAAAARPAVMLYADEAPISFGAMGVGATLDLERVEVLKGPQGILFGSNSTGGAVNFVAAKPTRDLHYGADLSYGRFNELNVSGYLSGPLSDGIRARLAVSHQRMDDWQYGYTNDRTNGSKDITSGRFTLEMDPAPNVRMRFTVSGAKNRSDSQAPQLVGKDLALSLIQPAFLAYPLAPNDNRAADFSATFPRGHSLQRDDWNYQAIARIDVDVTPDLTLTSLTSYAKAHQSRGFDTDGTTLAITDLYLLADLRSITQEFRATGKLGDFGSFILGANYENHKTLDFSDFDIHDGRSGHVFDRLGLPPTDSVPQIAYQDSEVYAVFGNLDINLTSTLTLRGGVRFTQATTDFRGCAQAGGNLTYMTGTFRTLGVAPVASGECATLTPLPGGGYRPGLVSNTQDESNIGWRAVLDWKPKQGMLFYGSVSRGFKVGAFSNISAVFSTQYTPVPQEQLTAYEVGVKADLIPRVLHVNAALFYYDYNNKQLIGTVIVPVFNTLTALVSIPKSEVKGAEIEVTLRPVDGLSLSGSATYVDSRVTKHFISNTTFGPFADFYGHAFPNTPKWQANGRIAYEFPISGSLNAFLGTDITYRGHSDSDFIPDPRLSVPAYTLLDAQAGISTADGKWRFQIWGKNLTNEVYSTTIVRRQEALVRTTGMPVTYGLSIGMKY